MIVYSSTKREFINDVLSGCVDTKILDSYVRETGNSISVREQESQRNSMQYMKNVIDDSEIPEDAGVAIEYKIPQTAKRIDFILTGKGTDDRPTAVIIELKQWSKGISLSEKDGIVNAVFMVGEKRIIPHIKLGHTQRYYRITTAVSKKKISILFLVLFSIIMRKTILSQTNFTKNTLTKPLFFLNEI